MSLAIRSCLYPLPSAERSRLESLRTLGLVLYREGKVGEVGESLRECFERRKTVLGDQYPKV